jgi:hypothetical protein
VAQAATRASQAILSKQQGKDIIKIDNGIYPAMYVIGHAISFRQLNSNNIVTFLHVT